MKPWKRFEDRVDAWLGDQQNRGKTWEIQHEGPNGPVTVRVGLRDSGAVVFSIRGGPWVIYDADLRLGASSGDPWCVTYFRRPQDLQG